MHTVRNRHANKTRAEAARSKRRAKPDDLPHLPGAGPPARFPADLIVPPHRGSVITNAAWPGPELVLTGRKAVRNAERRAAAVARVAVAAPTTEDLIILPAVVDVPAPVEILPMPAPDMPLPAGRALVARRQGFVDVIAFALRDSGRRLARWSSARRRADDMKEKLVRAEARMRAMEAQLAALQALQDRVRAAG